MTKKEQTVRTINPPDRALRLHGSIARTLGVAIVSGKYAPGDILLGEVDSSEKLRVSRTAYREAVRILAAKGLVESRPKVGTRVSPRAEWHLLDADVLGWIFSGDPDNSVLRSIFELRSIMEPAAAALAAQRRTRKHVEDLHDALDRMTKHTLAAEAGRVADRDFHAVLLSASDNPFIVSLTNGVTAAVAEITEYKSRNTQLRRDPVPDHERVLIAVEAKDAEGARAAMVDLIRLAMADIPMAAPRPSTAPRKAK